MLEKQDSNQVGLYMSLEVASDDGPVLAANPVFETREPNTYGSFGGSYKKVARKPFNASRQNQKGTTSDLDTAGDWNEDVTQNNLNTLLQGFFFAAMRRKALQSVTAITTPDDEYTVADSSGFPANSILFASGFNNSANNGAKHVTNSAAGVITVAEVLAPEVVAAGAAKSVTRVGERCTAGDCHIAVVGNLAVLTFVALDPSTLGLIPGEWMFVGGDLAVTQFASVKPGYGRVNSVDAANKKIYMDKFTSVIGAADVGAAKTIELYFGFLFKNEDDTDLIVKSTFTCERPLGQDDDGTQSENISKFVLSSLKWNSPLSNKVTIDITGVGLNYDQRTGAEGLLSKQVGAIVNKAFGEEAFNTSTNVYRLRLSLIDPDTLYPTALFARCTEWTATINNNVTASKSQGTLGGFDTTVGQFDVALTMTAYFTTVAAIQAIKDNLDCTFDAIYAKKNAGIIHDYPLVSPGGGALTIAQNQPIMMPLTNDASESPFGHTALVNFFPYLPSVAMAQGG